MNIYLKIWMLLLRNLLSINISIVNEYFMLPINIDKIQYYKEYHAIPDSAFSVKRLTLRKHAYIILTPSNPTFI